MEELSTRDSILDEIEEHKENLQHAKDDLEFFDLLFGKIKKGVIVYACDLIDDYDVQCTVVDWNTFTGIVDVEIKCSTGDVLTNSIYYYELLLEPSNQVMDKWSIV